MEDAEILQPIKLTGVAFRSPGITYFNYRAFYLFWLQKMFPEIEAKMRGFLPRFNKLIGTTLANENRRNYPNFYEELFSPPSYEGYGRQIEILKFVSQTDSELKKIIDYENQKWRESYKLAKEISQDPELSGLSLNDITTNIFREKIKKDVYLQESLKYKDEIISEFYTLRDDFFHWTVKSHLDKEWIRAEVVRALCNGQTIIKPSFQLVINTLGWSEAMMRNFTNLYENRFEKENLLIDSKNAKLKKPAKQASENLPDAFVFLETFENYSNEKEYENAAVEAYRKHIKAYIQQQKIELSEYFSSIRGNQPNYEEDIKIIIAWNKGATVSQIEAVFGISQDGINSLKQRCKKYGLPVRKHTGGGKRELIINKERISVFKKAKANNDEWRIWLEM
jgi:hypothetical protein